MAFRTDGKGEQWRGGVDMSACCPDGCRGEEDGRWKRCEWVVDESEDVGRVVGKGEEKGRRGEMEDGGAKWKTVG